MLPWAREATPVELPAGIRRSPMRAGVLIQFGLPRARFRTDRDQSSISRSAEATGWNKRRPASGRRTNPKRS